MIGNIGKSTRKNTGKIASALAIGLALTGAAILAQSPAAQNPAAQAAQTFSHVIPNIPGKSLTAVEVSYPPGGSSAPHTHAKSAFIFGYVLSGAIVTQVEGGPEQTVRAGQTFYENPGAHHILGRNASATEPAKFLAVFVLDSSETVLTTPDKK